VKLSDIIKAVKEDIEVYGDVDCLSYKYTHIHAGTESARLSKTRKDKNGRRLKMTIKELREEIRGKHEQ